ncbi:MAG: macro domain-containing protein [Acidobacteria bacterium]|nr:macro domain-containing protein [Acidobacteriota bacterium]MCI0720968.1 macro domain-containing protein [Acidobacteriota bacterium]
MSNTCFVIMPYGKKKDIDGKEIDFDEIYERVIKDAVESLDGFECQRCDDIEQPGWVHERMLRHICEDLVAIVDTSTLNANVFYELGVRHALRRSVTVLIHREGTSWPFNIAGLSSIEYSTNPKGVKEAKNKICRFILNALKDPKNTDSLVYHAVPDLRVERGPVSAPKPLSKVELFKFPLAQNPGKSIALITGDREYIIVADVWVNSENTDMQMDRFYEKSTSATIRYLGAQKHPISGRVQEDTIGDELARQMGEEKQVDPATVIPTKAGALQKNNVKWIFHAASVEGEPREGYHPVKRIERCVTNALRRADSKEFLDDQLKSILFPIFGTGPGGGDFREHAELCINAAVDYLESNPGSSIETAYFYAWSDVALQICRGIVERHPRLKSQ